MTMRLGAKMRSAVCALVSGTIAATAPVLAHAQQQPAGVLRPGLVIDAQGGVAYVMAANGGIAAVDLTSGAPRWTSTIAGKPLALVGNLLVAQVEPRAQGNRLGVVSLRTTTRGERVSSDTVILPAGVRVSLGETLHGTFNLTAQPSGADVTLLWTFVPAPKRGMEEQADTLTSPGVRQGPPGTRRGLLRVRPSTGVITTLDTTRVPAPRAPQWILPAEAKISGAAPTQYESADGRHIVASERVGDERVWDKYRWTVYERSGRRIGEVRTHIAFTPFVVRDSLVVFETTPYERAGQAPEPAKLRAFSMAAGREVWSVPVREIVFRGPYPP